MNALKIKLSRITEYTVSLIVVCGRQTIFLLLATPWQFARVARHPPRLARSETTTEDRTRPTGASKYLRARDETLKPPEINS